MSLANLYRNAWQQRFGLGNGWTANWWPGTAISLGQRGVMRDGQLQHYGYVGDYGVSFVLDPVLSPVSGPWDYSSSGDTRVEIGTDARVPGWEWLGHAAAGLSITFGNQESIYLSASGTTIERVANLDRLQANLVDAAVQRGMPVGQSVVVERQLTTQALLVVSGDKAGELRATASGDAQIGAGITGAVASFSGHLDIKKQSGGTSKQDFPNGMILAYRVVTLGTKGWWYWRHLNVRAINPLDANYLEATLQEDDYFVRF